MGLNKEAYIRYKIIDECITNNYAPFPSMQDLINKCEEALGKTFSESTIQKDIKAMKEDEQLGFIAPIKYSKKNLGYYYTKENYSINFIPLNTIELNALEAASDILNVFSGSRISNNYNQAVTKIFASIKEKKQRIEGSQKIIQTDEQINHKGFEYFDILYYSISNKIPVNFIHYSYTKKKYNSIIAHPFMLKEFQNNWYLLAYSEEHKELRTFGLDRIHDPLLLNTEFNNINIEIINNYYSDIYGVYPIPKEKKQIISFKCNSLFSKYIKANPIHQSQKISKINENGSIIFELDLIPSFELLNFFTQYYKYIQVIQPMFIMDKIYNSTINTSKYYKTRINGIDTL